MAKNQAVVKLKVKGSPEQVRKAIDRLAGGAGPEKPAPMLREADFRRKQKGKNFIQGVV